MVKTVIFVCALVLIPIGLFVYCQVEERRWSNAERMYAANLEHLCQRAVDMHLRPSEVVALIASELKTGDDVEQILIKDSSGQVVDHMTQQLPDQFDQQTSLSIAILMDKQRVDYPYALLGPAATIQFREGQASYWTISRK
jgi:hypothetical protein